MPRWSFEPRLHENGFVALAGWHVQKLLAQDFATTMIADTFCVQVFSKCQVDQQLGIGLKIELRYGIAEPSGLPLLVGDV